MTERTIRSMAKELAGIFYEENRSEGFRKTFPTLRAYMRGQWHQPDGSIKAHFTADTLIEAGEQLRDLLGL